MKHKGGFFPSFFLLLFPMRCFGRIQPRSLPPAATGSLWDAPGCLRKPTDEEFMKVEGGFQNLVHNLVFPEA